MDISGRSVPARSQEVVFRRVDNESVFVPIRGSAADLQNIYTANTTGARVWELVDDARTVDDIADVIAAEYDVAPETARCDTRDFLAQLTEAGCVSWADQPGD